jgi:hypothetical protein
LPKLGSRRARAQANPQKGSGKRRGQRCIEGGRAVVRCVLDMATLVTSRHNPLIRAFYQRLLAARAEKVPRVLGRVARSR